jgi:uncharacterized membrane protein YfcA
VHRWLAAYVLLGVAWLALLVSGPHHDWLRWAPLAVFPVFVVVQAIVFSRSRREQREADEVSLSELRERLRRLTG